MSKYTLFIAKNADKESQIIEALRKSIPIMSIIVFAISLVAAFFIHGIWQSLLKGSAGCQNEWPAWISAGFARYSVQQSAIWDGFADLTTREELVTMKLILLCKRWVRCYSENFVLISAPHKFIPRNIVRSLFGKLIHKAERPRQR